MVDIHFLLVPMCVKKHESYFLACPNACFGFVEIDHKIKYYPSINNERDTHRGTQPTLYVNQTRHEQEGFPDMFTSMLKVFHLDVYTLLDPSDTLPFVTPYVARRFHILPPVLLDLFMSLLLLVKILWLRDLVAIDMSPYLTRSLILIL